MIQTLEAKNHHEKGYSRRDSNIFLTLTPACFLHVPMMGACCWCCITRNKIHSELSSVSTDGMVWMFLSLTKEMKRNSPSFESLNLVPSRLTSSHKSHSVTTTRHITFLVTLHASTEAFFISRHCFIVPVSPSTYHHLHVSSSS